MKHTSAIILLFLAAALPLTLRAQRTSGGLGVPGIDRSPVPEPFIHQLTLSHPDTAKVHLLLKISAVYWFRRRVGDMDTCLSFAQEAYQLSSRLHDTLGSNESLCLMAKALTKLNDMPQAIGLLKLVYGEEKARLLLVIAERYVNAQPVEIPYLDKARSYIAQALALSESAHSERWRHECLLLSGKYYFERGDFAKGKASMMQIINDCHQSGDMAGEAHYWSELVTYMPQTDSSYGDHVHASQMAYQLYEQTGNRKDAIYVLRDLAVLNDNYSHFDSSLNQLLRVLSMLDAAHLPTTYATLDALSRVYADKGDLDKALTYTLKTLGTLTDPSDRRFIYVYARMAFIYNVMGFNGKSLVYSRKSFDLAEQYNDMSSIYFSAYDIVTVETNLGEENEALPFVLALEKTHPPTDAREKETIAAMLGMIYSNLKNYEKAEQYYLQMIAFDKAAATMSGRLIFGEGYLGSEEASSFIGDFYTKRKRYKEALPYVQKALAARQAGPNLWKGNLEYDLYLIEKGLGDYKSSLKHYILYKEIQDSIFSVEKFRQLQDMQVKYETDQKEQSIRLLQSQAQNQQTALRQARTQRNLTLAGIAMLLLLSGTVYTSYRSKQKSNRRLLIQQKKINNQNISLHKLVGDKNNLLTEKDLLLKEVHHRVKNNLHLVISLLESQSAYLKNNAAMGAILESQNRIRVIALIHQKLYNFDNVTQVDMRAYVPELVNYLRDSFQTAQHDIMITHSAAAIKLDVEQAVPIGLILNEAITNAIKYAFPHGQSGKISVYIQPTDQGAVELLINDNGIGLPRDFDLAKTDSMGMTLIRGLSKQLHGQLTITCQKGVQITLIFEARVG